MSKKQLSDNETGLLLLILAIALGTWARISLPAETQFPIGDGGLFYKMVETLQKNNFVLPLYVEYNHVEIPFAYPPLAFYLAGWLGKIFDITTLSLLTWMPAIVLTFAIPLVYMLANLFLGSRLQAGLATLIYALTPRSITWLIMGGGITRSIGHIFQILALSQIYLLFKTGHRKYLFSSILLSAGVSLSHPEAALHTVGIALLLWFFYGRTRQGFLNALLVGVGTLAVTSPWWLTILARFGISPYLAAFQTGGIRIPLASFFVFIIPHNEEKLLTIISLLSIFGLFLKLKHKQYFLPAFFVLPFILEPRNAANVYILPMAMLASSFIIEFLLPAFGAQKKEPSFLPAVHNRSQFGFLAYLLIALIANILLANLKLITEKTVLLDMRNTAKWIKENTEPSSRILLISGETDLLSDYDNEWLPLLTERASLTTIQGTEWISGGAFRSKFERIQSLQECPFAIEPNTCLETVVDQKSIDYILVKTRDKQTGHLITSLIHISKLEIVYHSQDMVIFSNDHTQ